MIDTIDIWQSPKRSSPYLYICCKLAYIHIQPKIVIKSQIVLGVIYE